MNIWSKIIFPLALGAILLSTGCQEQSHPGARSAPQLPPLEVQVARATQLEKLGKTEVVGTVAALHQAEIAAKVTGNISKLTVHLGSKVAAGDLLLEISAGEISAKLQQAKAQLEQAKRNLLREETLLKKNAATRETVKTMQDNARIAEAAYEEARTMLAYTQVTAPFAGTITQKFANKGDLATPGRTLLKLEDQNQLEVLTDIPEAMMLQIAIGDKLKVYIPSVNLQTEGTVSEISPIADPSSRSAPLKLRLPADPKLRPGQFARVTLALAKTQTLVVPAEAISRVGQMERVFTVRDGKAQLRLVRSGAVIDHQIEVLSGLNAGEEVIISGETPLVDGQPLTIR